MVPFTNLCNVEMPSSNRTPPCSEKKAQRKARETQNPGGELMKQREHVESLRAGLSLSRCCCYCYSHVCVCACIRVCVCVRGCTCVWKEVTLSCHRSNVVPYQLSRILGLPIQPDCLAREPQGPCFHLPRYGIITKFHQAKPTNPNSIPGTYRAEEENHSHKTSPDLPACCGTCVRAYTYSNKYMF